MMRLCEIKDCARDRLHNAPYCFEHYKGHSSSPSFAVQRRAARISAKAQLLGFLRENFHKTSKILVSHRSPRPGWYKMIGLFHFDYPAATEGSRAQVEKVFNIIDRCGDCADSVFQVKVISKIDGRRNERSKHIDLRVRKAGTVLAMIQSMKKKKKDGDDLPHQVSCPTIIPSDEKSQ